MESSSASVRRATLADATVLHAIRRDRELWLVERGVEQWEVGEISVGDIDEQINAGEWFVGVDSSGTVLGGLRYLASDLDVWPDGVDDSARYVHGLMTDRRRAAAGSGTDLLSWAEQLALREGADVMRLDCVESNQWLRLFYRNRGYQEVGRHDFDGPWFSVTLFEKPLRAPNDVPVIRRPKVAEIEELPELEIASWSVYESVGMAQVATGNEPDLEGLKASHAAGNVLAAESDGELAGFVECRIVDETMYIAGVSVAPAFARRGLGAALLDAAQGLAHEQGVARMSLTTFRDVPWNAPYYERLGWRLLADGDTPAGLSAIRERQRVAGYEQWPRVTMIKDVESS